MTTSRPTPSNSVRRGVVAVAWCDARLLVIRRSQLVSAPGALCFPGGGIEPGESEEQALVREMHEELACAVRPLRRLWTSVTAWQVELAWWHVELLPPGTWTLNQAEVSEVHWLTVDDLAGQPDLLTSNLEFLAAWQRGEFVLSDRHRPAGD